MSGPDVEGSMEGDPADAIADIEATLRDYIEGWYDGDVERMERSLHDDLVKRIRADATGREFRPVSKERMVGLTEAGGGGTPGAEYEIAVHHVSDGIASAHVDSREYLDYAQLVETSGGWKIAQILFRMKHEGGD